MATCTSDRRPGGTHARGDVAAAASGGRTFDWRSLAVTEMREALEQHDDARRGGDHEQVVA